MTVIGELFDLKMGKNLVEEMQKLNFKVEAHQVTGPSGTIIQIRSLDQSTTQQAQEYFRVRMGLPGAPTEIDPAWLEIKNRPFGPVTKFLIIASVMVFIVSFNEVYFKPLREFFFINDPHSPKFSSLESFEIWRLVTPIFLHFGWLHIVFNCMWIKDLGSYWESEVRAKAYIGFVLVLAVTSNLAQYIVIGPKFGGLSGVVYGLFGLSWGRIMLGDKDALNLPKRDIYLMIGWYFLCLSGVIGNIANVAHGVGLGFGLFLSLVIGPIKGMTFNLEWKNILKVLLLSAFFCISSFVIEFLKNNYL